MNDVGLQSSWASLAPDYTFRLPSPSELREAPMVFDGLGQSRLTEAVEETLAQLGIIENKQA